MDEQKLVTKAFLARRYKTCTRTIENWMKDFLPFIKIGNKYVRFDLKEADLAVEKFKVNPVE